MKPLLLIVILSSVVLLATGCAAPPVEPTRIDLLGEPAIPASATGTVIIHPDVQHVNVTGGQVIQFIVGDQAFAWNFDSIRDLPPFDLRLIAPPGVTLDHRVMVYVAPNPLYLPHRGPFWSPWPP